MNKLTILLAFLLAICSCTKEMPCPSGQSYYSSDPGDPGDYSDDPGDYSDDNGDNSGDDGDNSDDGNSHHVHVQHHSTPRTATITNYTSGSVPH